MRLSQMRDTFISQLTFPVRPLSLALTSGATYVARTAAVNPNQAQEILAEAIEHDGFAHIDFLTQCPTWNKDAKQYVPYIDVQQDDDYDFDVRDRDAAADMARKAESALYEGRIPTGRFYREESRPAYHEEKRAVDELPDRPVAEQYFDEEREWERSFGLVREYA